jgi:hypothetical protein
MRRIEGISITVADREDFGAACMTVDLLGPVSTIHLMGESHCLAFTNILFRPAWSPDVFHCRTWFSPTLMAGQWADAQKNLHSELLDALVAQGILDRERRPAFLFTMSYAAFLAATPLIAPPVVFFAGDLDLHQLFKQFGDRFDFELPDDPGYGVDRSKQPIPFMIVRDRISDFLTPFLTGVMLLQSVQFSRLMVHCLPPRTRDDTAAASWTGIIVNGPVRAKLTLLANRVLSKICGRGGLGFIDTWPELTTDGYLHPKFELDGVHVNRQAALITLDKVAAHLFDHTATIWNAVRYQQAQSHADRYVAENESDGGDNWRMNGLHAGTVAAAAVAAFLHGLSFTEGHGNRHARPDWCGWPRAGRSGVTVEEPSDALLEQASRLLGQGEGRSILHGGAESELTVSSFRPIRISPGGEVAALSPCPPGARLALLHLGGNGALSFETVEGQRLPMPPTEAGGLVVYDPKRVRCRPEPGADGLDLVELALIPRLAGQPFRVVWAGLNDWPADPFQHSVAGLKAFPPFEGDSFRVAFW